MIIKYRLSNCLSSTEFVGLKLAGDGLVSLKSRNINNNKFVCLIKYENKTYEVELTIGKNSYADLNEIKDENGQYVNDGTTQYILLYAAIVFLRKLDDKPSELDIATRLKRIITSYTSSMREKNIAPSYLFLLFAPTITSEERKDKVKTLKTFQSALNVATKNLYRVQDRMYLIYALADYLGYSDKEFSELTSSLYSYLITNLYSYELGWCISKTFSAVNDKHKNAILEAITPLLDLKSPRINLAKYKQITDVSLALLKEGVLNQEIMLFLFRNKQYQYSFMPDRYIKYALKHGFTTVLECLNEKDLQSLDCDTFKEYIRYAVNHNFKNTSTLVENLLYSSSFDFYDYIWFSRVFPNRANGEDKEKLEAVAKNAGFYPAYKIYSHDKSVSVKDIKNLRYDEFIFLKDILLSEYKNATVQSLCDSIIRKLSLKNINEKTALESMSLLKEFSPIEYAKMRNNAKVKTYLSKASMFRYDDLLSLSNSGLLDKNHIYVYRK